MPSFPNGSRIWLESDGQELEEYGEVQCRGSHNTQAIEKTVYVEILPNKPFEIKHTFTAPADSAKDVNVGVDIFTDGRQSDFSQFIISHLDPPRTETSIGHRTGPRRCSPYRFAPALLNEIRPLRTGLKFSETLAVGTIEVWQRTLEAFDPPIPRQSWFGSENRKRQPLAFSPFGKAAVLGFAVQSSDDPECQASSRGIPAYETVEDDGIDHTANFLYRPRDTLVRMGFIDDGEEIEAPSPPAPVRIESNEDREAILDDMKKLSREIRKRQCEPLLEQKKQLEQELERVKRFKRERR